MQSNELSFLFTTVLLIFSLLIIILLYLIIRKISTNRKNVKIKKITDKYYNLIFHFIAEDVNSRGIRPETHLQQEALEQALAKYAEVLEGENERKALTFLAETHLTNYYLKHLHSYGWSERMNALYHIEDFKMSSLEGEVLKLLAKKRLSRDEIIHCLRVLASLNNRGLFDLLTKKYGDLYEYEYRNILIRLHVEQLDKFILGFHQSPEELKFAILDVLGIKKEIRYLSFVEKVYASYSGEVKLRALKTLAGIGYVKNLEAYLPLCESPVWQERMFLAKLIGTLKDSNAISYLVKLLHDQSWWVRSQAGQAIARFPNSKIIFKRILMDSEDAYARDMAEEWLLRDGGGLDG